MTNHGVRIEQPLADRLEWAAIETLAIAHRIRTGRKALASAIDLADRRQWERVAAVLNDARDLEEETLLTRGRYRQAHREWRRLERWAALSL
ncbi:MAG: hypothetical protein ACRDQZ_03190 [Mycobacteriales bacterium]